MLYPTDDRVRDDVLPAPMDERSLPLTDGPGENGTGEDGTGDESTGDESTGQDGTGEDTMAEAVRNLRALIMAGERYRQSVAGSGGLGTTESQAISYLAVHGARGQSELAGDLSLTSSAATALSLIHI